MTIVTNIHKNIMGTVSFTAKFSTCMRKEQEFIIYPNPFTKCVRIQSDTYCGEFSPSTGQVLIVRSHSFVILNSLCIKFIDKIDNLEELLTAIKNTAGEPVGNSIVRCDNSTAAYL